MSLEKMKKTLCYISIFLAFLTGCQPTKLQIAEKKYHNAKQQGLLPKQLIIIEELKTLAPNQYITLDKTKKQLAPLIVLLSADENNFDSMSDEQFKLLIQFSPNSPLVKKIQRYHKEKNRLISSIDQLKSEITNAGLTVQSKLQPTPNQISTFATEIRLDALPQDILTQHYWQALLTTNDALNSYQLESLLTGLTELAAKSQQLAAKQKQLSEIMPQNLVSSPLEFTNSDIRRVLAALYQQQISHCYSRVIEQNERLLYLLNTGLGRQRLDIFWQNSFKPAARKAVLEIKSNHLKVLEKIASYAKVVPVTAPAFLQSQKDYPAIKAIMINLLWPKEGLYEFADNSEGNRLALKKYIAI